MGWEGAPHTYENRGRRGFIHSSAELSSEENAVQKKKKEKQIANSVCVPTHNLSLPLSVRRA